ncbi:hypothetical protein ACFVZ3_08355 [Kitasatospora purpeofusca]|uniref:hypothetical protein n=1 Tax=Kitasatospora purpeofusca TaxID=67352 RepID=UPI0036920436
MGETITTGDGLRVLRGPETLLDAPAARLSHGGLLDTPAGLATILVLEHRPVAPPAGAAPAWLVHLAQPGHRDATLALPTVLTDTEHGLQIAVCVFGRATGHDPTVMAVHHPDLPRPASLFLDAPAPPPPYTGWAVEPALLAPPTTRAPQVWHTGLLRAGPVLFTHLEATADEPGLLDQPQWDITPHRPEGTPLPLRAAFDNAAHHRQSTYNAGPGHVCCDTILDNPPVPEPFTWTCHPRELSARHLVHPT